MLEVSPSVVSAAVKAENSEKTSTSRKTPTEKVICSNLLVLSLLELLTKITELHIVQDEAVYY